MADWSKIGSRGNVEDRRGSPMAVAGGGLGIVGIGIVLLIQYLSTGTVDVGSVLNQFPSANGPASSLTNQDFQGEDDYEKFTATVLGSTNDTWRQIFASDNRQYREPRLVLFRAGTQSGCGVATSDVGPHYCPADSTIYIDETFYDELKKRFNAEGGDVAEAYVLAHEVGHHVQHQLGLIAESGAESNNDSIRAELQADCFAGVWAYSIKDLGVFGEGEINEAQNAAAAVGDDRIQSKVTGQINKESWTHGSSEQRVKWFNLGYEKGSPASCDTSKDL
jgi:predicted metalloprotease